MMFCLVCNCLIQRAFRVIKERHAAVNRIPAIRAGEGIQNIYRPLVFRKNQLRRFEKSNELLAAGHIPAWQPGQSISPRQQTGDCGIL